MSSGRDLSVAGGGGSGGAGGGDEGGAKGGEDQSETQIKNGMFFLQSERSNETQLLI